MENLTWNLFKETGDIKYFLMYSKIKEDGKYENRESRRNNNKRN